MIHLDASRVMDALGLSDPEQAEGKAVVFLHPALLDSAVLEECEQVRTRIFRLGRYDFQAHAFEAQEL